MPSAVLVARLVLLLVVLVAAVFFRLYRLDSVPPGLHHDEAYNGVDILDLQKGARPLFFERNNGREPLFLYAQAVSVRLLGETTLALRAVSALFGLAAILATLWLAAEWFGFRAGVLAIAGMAVTLSPVAMSRVGLRGISAQVFVVLFLLLFWKGLRGNHRWYAAAGGVCFGLAFYTYTAARAVAALVLLLLLLEWFRNRQDLLRGASSLGHFALAATTVAAPLFVYFARHPDSFFRRAEQVSVLKGADSPGEWPSALESFVKTIGAFNLSGDQNWVFNLPGRPLLDPLLGALFILGLGAAAFSLRHLRSPKGNGSRLPLASAWLLSWFLVALLPGALSGESPSFLRLTMATPAVFVLVGLGGESVWSWLASRWRRPGNFLGAACLCGLLAWTALGTFQTYFGRWASDPSVYWVFDSNISQAVRYAERAQASDRKTPPVFFYPDRTGTPIVQFLAAKNAASQWLPKEASVLKLSPSVDEGALYLFPPSVYESWGESYFLELGSCETQQAPDGRPAFHSCTMPAETLRKLMEPVIPIRATFDDEVELVGASNLGKDLDQKLLPGEVADVVLLWRVKAGTDHTYRLFVHLLDGRDYRWGQADLIAAGSRAWQPGDLLLSRHRIAVPPGVPPIPLRLVVGATTLPSDVRLKAGGADLVELCRFEVGRDAGSKAVVPQHPLDVSFGGQIRLLGFDLPTGTVGLGQELPLTVYWQAITRPAQSYTVFVHLLDERNAVVGQQDNPPVRGSFPTSDWKPGDVVEDPYRLALSPFSEVRPGDRLLLEVGLYDPASGHRLKIVGSDEDRVILGQVTVR